MGYGCGWFSFPCLSFTLFMFLHFLVHPCLLPLPHLRGLPIAVILTPRAYCGIFTLCLHYAVPTRECPWLHFGFSVSTSLCYLPIGLRAVSVGFVPVTTPLVFVPLWNPPTAALPLGLCSLLGHWLPGHVH